MIRTKGLSKFLKNLEVDKAEFLPIEFKQNRIPSAAINAGITVKTWKDGQGRICVCRTK